MKEKTETAEFRRYKREKARDYLYSVRRARLTLFTLLSELSSLRQVASITGPNLSGMPRNPNASDDNIINAVLAIEARSEALKASMETYIHRIYQCDDILKLLTSHELAGIILKMKYIENLPFKEIAVLSHYNEGYIKSYIIKDGLEELYDLMPGEYRDQIPHAV